MDKKWVHFVLLISQLEMKIYIRKTLRWNLVRSGVWFNLSVLLLGLEADGKVSLMSQRCSSSLTSVIAATVIDVVLNAQSKHDMHWNVGEKSKNIILQGLTNKICS